MPTLSQLRISGVNTICIAALLWLLPVTRAQAAETFTATARVTGSGGAEATAPVRVIIDRFSTDADRDKVIAAAKQRGSTGVRDLLIPWTPIGNVVVGSNNTVIKYAYARTTPEGRLITVVTGSPIMFIGAGQPGAPLKQGFDSGLVLLNLTTSGPGHGEMTPAAKVKVNDQGAISTEDYSGQVVVLSNVVVGK